jgi:hypothetical protein
LVLTNADHSHLRHNDLAWNIRNFIHNNLDKVNLSTNIKFQERAPRHQDKKFQMFRAITVATI